MNNLIVFLGRSLVAAALLTALAVSGCSTQESSTPPRGVSLIESRGQAKLQISAEVWSATSCSIRLYENCWVVDLYPAIRPASAGVPEQPVANEPKVRLRLQAYAVLSVQFVDSKGAVLRNESLQGMDSEEESQ